MRKPVVFILTMFLLLGLCGCKSTNTENRDANSLPAESVENDTDNDADNESLTEKCIHEIDRAYLEDSKLPEFSTTAGKVELTCKYTERWGQVADECYNKIMEYDGTIQLSESSYSPDDLHTFVSNMKTNWEQYNQVQCENYGKILQAIYGSGTIVGPIFAGYQYEMEKGWALQLVGICEQLHIK